MHPFIFKNTTQLSSYIHFPPEKKETVIEKNEKILKSNPFEKTKMSTPRLQVAFLPFESDSLFWCFYVLQHGESEYYRLKDRTKSVEREIKIRLVEQINKNAPKLKLPLEFEKQMVFDSQISIETFLFLCDYEKLAVTVVLGLKQFTSSFSSFMEQD